MNFPPLQDLIASSHQACHGDQISAVKINFRTYLPCRHGLLHLTNLLFSIKMVCCMSNMDWERGGREERRSRRLSIFNVWNSWEVKEPCNFLIHIMEKSKDWYPHPCLISYMSKKKGTQCPLYCRVPFICFTGENNWNIWVYICRET